MIVQISCSSVEKVSLHIISPPHLSKSSAESNPLSHHQGLTPSIQDTQKTSSTLVFLVTEEHGFILPQVLLFFITVCAADGFLNYRVANCEFNSTELNDIEYIESYYYNKLEFITFRSSVGKFVGINAHGEKNAERWNKGPEVVRARAAKATYCLHNVGIFTESALTKSVKPSIRLHSVAPPAGKHPAMLVCSVYDFYPKLIRVSWQRDGQEVTHEVTSTDELADGDWFYQIHSHLEYTPRSGEKISCVVEHASLSKPLITDWDPSMPESERNKIAIGTSGLILGLTLSLAGFIYYKRKAQGRILVPTN
ncbi:H-2 class II histocompatibility antigen, E-S beta chain-like [Hippoglossus stenolepis]|uniref:H-2 class II histocompatibility antigen, E-S beta chain-like n=1 Tax=Hippoglossus stenolepis TaxID=195615 RepID=UPI001FAEB786|nr:H-2 class II histocompatibility antigen, E-S beta chain-like [Hippoglossus stenolepis]